MSRRYTRLFNLTSIESLWVLLFIMSFAIPVKAQFTVKNDSVSSGHQSLQNTTLRGDIGNTIDLPKTGQTFCHSMFGEDIDCALTGQDGDIQAGVDWPDPRFTDNEDGTMTDRLTGLMWTQDGSTPNVDTCVGGWIKWQPALNYVKCLNNIEYLGYTDWRLPNVLEHTSLAHGNGDTHTWLNTQGFINVGRNAFWTSTTYVGRDDSAWVVTLEGMMRNGYKRSHSNNIWPVRAGQTDGNVDPANPSNIWKTGQTQCWDDYGRPRSCAGTGEDGDIQSGVTWPESRFTDNLNETVTDNLTGLTWAQSSSGPGPEACTSGFHYNRSQANDYLVCLNKNSYLGRTNWRLPNFREFYSLIDYSQLAPALQPGHPFVTTDTHQVLSSTTVGVQAAIMNVGAGLVEARDVGLSGRYNVWPVSDGPSQLVPDIYVTDPTDPFDDLEILFGDVEVGEFADEIVTIYNIGNGDLTIEPIGTTRPIAAPFTIRDDFCSDQTLAPDGSCTFTVRCTPVEARLYSKSFSVDSDDPFEFRFNISARATGVEFVGRIMVQDDEGRRINSVVDFGDVPVGTSSDKTLGIKNIGTADLLIGTLAQIDTLDVPFSIVNDHCSDSAVIPDAICSFDVRFAPVVESPDDIDTFDIPSNDPDITSVTITVGGVPTGAQDDDEDGIPNNEDNCILTHNPDQADTDEDGKGDLCDECPLDNPDDTDADGVCDSDDTCPGFDDTVDTDSDGVADVCDICAGYDDTIDTDSDGVPDGCDVCPLDNPDDSDGDGVCDSDDGCPNTPVGDDVYENGCTVGQTIIQIIDSTGDGAGNPLTLPSGIAVDANGNTFVAGKSSHNIFKITPAGEITEIIDVTGDGEDISFSAPKGIAVDAAGNVYSTTSQGAVKITPGGVITQIIDGTAGGAGNLFGPHGIAVDTVGNVYVTGQSSHNAFKITPKGVITQIIDEAGAGVGKRLNSPQGITVDSVGYVYVVGGSSSNVFRITTGGSISEVVDGFTSPRGIAVSADRLVYVTSSFTYNVLKITGGIEEIIDSLGDNAGNVLHTPLGVAVDATGNVYVTGSISSNAFKITPAGVITEIIDPTGDGTGNILTGAEGIATDATGNVYVIGANSNNAFKIMLAGCENDDECDDGSFCNGAETCDLLLGCQAGTAIDCTDEDDCTIDKCDESTDSCTHTDGDSDEDGVCDSVDVCPGSDDTIDNDEDGTPDGCDDCRNDPDKITPGDCGCGIAEGSCGGCASDGDCDDGLYCNGVETCDAKLGCQDGTAVSCEDKNECTIDLCDEVNDLCTHDDRDSDGDGIPDECDECPLDNPNDNEDGACGPPPSRSRDIDRDGISNALDDCPGTTFQAVIDENGCSCDQLDGDEDGVDNCLDECADTLVTSEVVGETGCTCSQIDCDDDNDCTDDSCEDGICVNASSCTDDGEFCNGVEICDDRACLSSGNPCGDNETCNENTDSCDLDVTIGQPVPSLCGNFGDGCTITPPALILTFFGLFALRFAGPRKRFR